jgi:cytochrome P450
MTPASSSDPLIRLDQANRREIYAELRDHTPVFWSTIHTAWILTRYSDVNGVLRNPDANAVDATRPLRTLIQRGDLDLSSLQSIYTTFSFFTRPPLHDAVRRVMAQAAAEMRRPSLMQDLEMRADQILSAGRRDGSIDLASGYGQALALFVTATFFAIPDEDLPVLVSQASELMGIFEFTVHSVSRLLKLNECARELTAYFLRLVTARRRNPGSDGISLVTRLVDEHVRSSDEEIAQNCLNFFLAAQFTSGSAISAAALALLQRPELRRELLANPALRPAAAVEIMRLDPPVQYVGRQLSVDLQIGESRIRAGEFIFLMIGAANLDPAAFPEANEFRLDRTEPKPLTFAVGAYGCVGMQLAMLELDVAMRKILACTDLCLGREPPVWSRRKNFAPLERLTAVFA